MIDASASLQIVWQAVRRQYIYGIGLYFICTRYTYVVGWRFIHRLTQEMSLQQFSALGELEYFALSRTHTSRHPPLSRTSQQWSSIPITSAAHIVTTHQQAQQQHTKTANETHFRSVTDGIHLAFSGLPQLGFQQSYSAALTEMSYWDNHLTLLYINGRQTTHEKINIQYTEKFITSVSETIRKPALVKDCVQK